MCVADTYMLSDEGLSQVATSPLSRFAYSQSKLKELIDNGDVRAAEKMYGQLKNEYPEFSGTDAEEFMAAEYLYAKGQMEKAGKAYKVLAAKYPLSNWYEAILERLYDVGVAYVSGYKKPLFLVFRISTFEDGTKLLNYVADITGDRPIAYRCLETLAIAYEKKGRYMDAFRQWSSIYTIWPTGKNAQTAMLGMARTLHSSYKGPEYDGGNLDYAYNSYQNYLLRYPESAEELGVEDVQKQIRNQEAYKEYLLGKFYVKVGNFDGAEMYFRHVLEDYRDTVIKDPAENALNRLAVLRKQLEKNPPKVRKGGWRFFDLIDFKQMRGYEL